MSMRVATFLGVRNNYSLFIISSLFLLFSLLNNIYILSFIRKESENTDEQWLLRGVATFKWRSLWHIGVDYKKSSIILVGIHLSPIPVHTQTFLDKCIVVQLKFKKEFLLSR